MGILNSIIKEVSYSIGSEIEKQNRLEELKMSYYNFVSNLKNGRSEVEKENIDFLFYDENEYKFIVNTLKKRDSINDISRIMEKVGLDESEIEETPPFFIDGYSYDDVYINGDYTSKYQIIWVFYTSNQMVIYKCVFDLISNKKIESVNEFFYKDVTSISTKNSIVKSREIFSKTEEVEIEVLKVNIVGEKIEIPLKDILEDKDEIINSMKNKLRDKKMLD